MCKLFFAFGLLFLPSFIFTKDFGKEGHVFKIDEENIKEHIQKKLATLPEEEIKKKLYEAARNPKQVDLPDAQIKRSFLYDPTYTFSETVKGESGEIIAHKGEKVNPLLNVELNEGLLFFDGSNPKHIEWAEGQKGEFIWILLKGSPIELEENKMRPVFFDQGGALSEKFGIKNIPCVVTQQGTKLLIQEIPLKIKGMNTQHAL